MQTTAAGELDDITLHSPKIIAGNSHLFEVSANGEPVDGKIYVISGGASVTELQIADGFAFYNAPKDMKCPILVRAIVPGYKTKSKTYYDPTCVEFSSSTSSGTSSIEFIPSTLDKKFERDSTKQIIINLRNSGTTKIKIISGTFSETTYSTKYGEQPIRLSTGDLSGTQMEPGTMLPIVFYVDTRGLETGPYNTIFSLTAEDATGKTISQTITPTITVVEQADNSTTGPSKQLSISISPENANVGDMVYFQVNAGNNAVDSATLKIYPNKDDASIYTLFYTPNTGKSPTI